MTRRVRQGVVNYVMKRAVSKIGDKQKSSQLVKDARTTT
jgi:hypothetical protein